MPPLKLRYHGLDQSDAIDTKLKARAEKLDRLFDRITACDVVVECTNHRHHKGRIYRVGIDLVVPDFVPFLDEILLAILTLVFARRKPGA